jgi:hypothetical protein
MNVRRFGVRGILVLVVVTMAACGGSGGADEPGEDSVALEDVAAGEDALADDSGPVPGEDTLSPDTTEPDVAPPRHELPPEYTCGAPDALVPCDAIGPMPADAAGVAQWAGANAVSLRCSDDQGEHWDFDIFASEFEGMGLFMMGEVHGSKEIGTASADLFEALVFGAGVNVAALEVGMDTSAAMNAYILTGDESVMDDGFFWGQYQDVMFRKTIPRRARKIYEETGVLVRVVGVDTPQRLAWVNEQITEKAQGLGAQAQGLLLDVLPAAQEPPYGSWGMGLDTAYVNLSKNYHKHVVDNQGVICADLDADACEDIEFLAWALYIGALFNSADFQAVMMGQGNPMDMMMWMNERESLLDYNFRRAAPDASTVVYAHMGAAHAAKGGWNVAAMLDEGYAPLQGRVYSVSPAYGPGSEIFYGYSTQNVPAEPSALAGPLAQLPQENYFVSTHHPGQDCSANPFSDAVAQRIGGAYGTSYDAFFWYRLLTPEQEGWGWGKPIQGEDWRAEFIRDQVQRMRFADRMMEELR